MTHSVTVDILSQDCFSREGLTLWWQRCKDINIWLPFLQDETSIQTKEMGEALQCLVPTTLIPGANFLFPIFLTNKPSHLSPDSVTIHNKKIPD